MIQGEKGSITYERGSKITRGQRGEVIDMYRDGKIRCVKEKVKRGEKERSRVENAVKETGEA